MFTIGPIRIRNRIAAAPMAGVSDKAFRLIARSFGCGLVFTEMISAMGLVYEQEKTRKIADIKGEEAPVAVQIFGSDPECMARAALIVEKMGAHIIDINMGCPTPKITKNGEGAALMLDLEKSREIIKEVVQAVEVPVTVKMRKGWDKNSINCIELAGAAEQEGASAVTLHPRTRIQFYSGRADWNMIKEVKERIKIPVIGNGDITSARKAFKMIEYTGCDGIMIGRAAMGNPFIFQETVELLENGQEIPPAAMEERVNIAIKHLELACQFKPEPVVIREMRKHFSWYIKTMPGATRRREQINKAVTREELISAISL
jgi:nifR3 family TIM-barrel protein